MVPTLKFPAPNRYVCGDIYGKIKYTPATWYTAASSMTSKRCAAKQPAATLSALVAVCLLRCPSAFFLPSTDAGKAALPGNKPAREGSSVARKVVVPDAERSSRSTGLSAFGGVSLEWDGAADRTALFGGAMDEKSSSLVARETGSDDDGEENRRAMMASALGQRGADGGGATAIETSGIGGEGAGARWRKGLRKVRSAVVRRILKRGDSAGGRGGDQVPIITATSTSAG